MTDMLINSGRFFLTILAELIPLFLIVTFLSGLAMEYISPETLRKSLSGRKGFLGQILAVGLGFVTPFCSCSTIPVLASMVKAGIPIGVMTAFLYASPYPIEIAIPVLAPLFGVPAALGLVVAGSAVALTSGSLAQQLGWQREVKIETSPAPLVDAPDISDVPLLTLDTGFQVKARRAWDYTLGFARKLLLIIVVSSAIGSLIYGFIPEAWILQYAGGDGLWVVPIAALLGVPLYVNAAAVVPIIYSLSLKGVSQGAVIAFLITATTISPPEMLMLSALFKRKYVIAFAVVTVIGAIITGYVLNWIA